MNRIIFFLGVTIIGLLGMYMSESNKLADKQNTNNRVAEANNAQTNDSNAKIKINDNITAYSTGNEALKAARAKARQSLPRFISMLNSGKPGTYTVKFPLTQNGNTEHIWLQVSSVQQKKYIGLLANEPVNGNQHKRGDAMIIDEKDVEDWMVTTRAGIYGGYSARVQIQDLPKDQAEQYAKRFLD